MFFSLKFWFFKLIVLTLYSSTEVCGSPVHNFREEQIAREAVPVNDVNYEDIIEFGRSNIINDASEKRFVYDKKRESISPQEGVLQKRMFYGKKGRSMAPEESALEKRFAYENGRAVIHNEVPEKRFVYDKKRESISPKKGVLQKRMFYGKKGRSMAPEESALEKRFAYENGRAIIHNEVPEKRFVYDKRESTSPKKGVLQKRMFYGKKGRRSMAPEESALEKRFAYENGRAIIDDDVPEKRFVYYKRESTSPKKGVLQKRMFYGKKGRRSMAPEESALEKRFAYENGRAIIDDDVPEKRFVYYKRESTSPKKGVLQKRMFYGKKGRSMAPEESALEKRFAYENGRAIIDDEVPEKRFVYYKRESISPKKGVLQKRMFYGKKGRRSMAPEESALEKRFAYENGRAIIDDEVPEKRFVYYKRESISPKKGVLQKRMFYGKKGRSMAPEESALEKRFAYENGRAIIDDEAPEKRFVYDKRESTSPKEGVLQKRMFYGKKGRSMAPEESALEKRFAYENGRAVIHNEVPEKRFVYDKRESTSPKKGVLQKRMFYGKKGRSMAPEESALGKRFAYENGRRSTSESSEDHFAKTDEDLSR